MPVSQDTGIFLMRYIQGEKRSQTALFPVSLDELIPDDHLVRVIEAYVWLLDFEQLKTIADFRRDNSAAFTATCRAFVRFCRNAGLIAGELSPLMAASFRRSPQTANI